MKKYLYYTLFILLGLLVSFLIHAGLEIYALHIISTNIEKYGAFYNENTLRFWHKIISLSLSISGLLAGLYFGKKFWQMLYVEEKYGKPRW